MRLLAALTACAFACALAPVSFASNDAGDAGAPQIVDLTVRPSGADLARVPGRGDAYAAVYDDRLGPSTLRYAERRDGLWKVRFITGPIDGRPVGREPTLAISPHGLRLAVFRTDLNLDEGQAPDGTLYAARSSNGEAWAVDRIDANGFGATPAFDGQGRPAIAYLVRLDTTNAAEVRLARYHEGAWHVQALARTTYRQAASDANASSVGLALDRYLALKVAYIDAASHSMRLVGEDAQPQRFGTVPATVARASLAFGASGEVGVVGAGLAGEESRLWVAKGRLGGATRTYPAMGRVGQLGRDHRLLAGRSDRRLPRSPRRVRRGAGRAQVQEHADRAGLALQRQQPVQRRVRRGRARARAASASRSSRTARCSCSPSARSRGASPEGVACWICDVCSPPSRCLPWRCSHRPRRSRRPRPP